jgi:endonuclease/exonuclease/phosphatase family metal-dependent hydrolase
MRCPNSVASVLVLTCLAGTASAQWDPAGGEWGKTDPNDLRVMTWNVRDTLCSTNNKSSTNNDWHAMARIIQLLQPDILILQECGDNSGNGTGAGVDSVVNLAATFELMMHGGPDPFLGGTATTFIQSWAPGYDLPHIFVSSGTDNFNRNIIVSRYPFADLNGDGKSTYSDIPTVSTFNVPGKWTPGGNGGIRGFMFTEIDLPAQYAGEFVVGNAHLKSGGDSSDLAQRLLASQNVAWVIEQWYNGAGTGSPDPAGLVLDSPQATNILGPDTPVVIGGDWNEDENTNGRKGPAAWLSQAEVAQPTLDGTDRDRTDSLLDTSVDLVGSRQTQNSGSKLDYLMWQDSIVTARRSFVFNSANINGGIPTPNAWVGIGFPSGLSSTASDHRAVVVDLILPLAPPMGACCIAGSCSDLTEADCLTAEGEYQGDGTDCISASCTPVGPCCFACAGEIVAPCPSAVGAGPSCIELTEAECVALSGLYRGDDLTCEDNPSICSCTGDINGDGVTTAADFTVLAGQFGGGDPDCRTRAQGDLNCDGIVNAADFTILAGNFGCGG